MENKVRVILKVGRQSVIGMMDPKVGMVTTCGTIAAVDASGICTMGDTDVHAHGGRSRFYAHQLYILEAVATSNGWPNASDCVKFGHGPAVTIRDSQAENKRDYVILESNGITHRTYSK